MESTQVERIQSTQFNFQYFPTLSYSPLALFPTAPQQTNAQFLLRHLRLPLPPNPTASLRFPTATRSRLLLQKPRTRQMDNLRTRRLGRLLLRLSNCRNLHLVRQAQIHSCRSQRNDLFLLLVRPRCVSGRIGVQQHHSHRCNNPLPHCDCSTHWLCSLHLLDSDAEWLCGIPVGGRWNQKVAVVL